MWDRPELLNAAASAFYGLAAVLALYAGAAALMQAPSFPLREVRVVSAPAQVTLEHVAAIVRSDLRGNFFTIDLDAARAAFEKLPWVRRAQVRRHWPARLDVALEEHVALARWGRSALVNTHGEVFEGAAEGELPLFNGPDGTAKEIAIQYEYFRRSLSAVGQSPAEVRISPRRAWQVRLASGLTLELGREHVEARLARFIAAYPRTVMKFGRQIDYVDLRYANGFAVRIPELKHEKAPARKRKAA